MSESSSSSDESSISELSVDLTDRAEPLRRYLAQQREREQQEAPSKRALRAEARANRAQPTEEKTAEVTREMDTAETSHVYNDKTMHTVKKTRKRPNMSPPDRPDRARPVHEYQLRNKGGKPVEDLPLPPFPIESKVYIKRVDSENRQKEKVHP